MGKSTLLILGLLLLFAGEILKVYFIMPFPGSQKSDTIAMAYFLHRYIIWLRVLGFVLVIPALYQYFSHGSTGIRILLSAILILYGVIFYLFNFKFLADKMFYQPGNKRMVAIRDNKVDSNKLVIGAVINGEARAYPIEIIGYHHQVQDSIGGTPVLVTYCTVCRTGRIYSPLVKNQYEHFRLVGMDHFNAMFEDATTKSWWRQVTGEAIAGPRKGSTLSELPSFQMRLGTWMSQYPGTLILQPDTLYDLQYADLHGYDSGIVKSSLEKRDSASWKFKSWIVGVSDRGYSRAYDWNQLVKVKVINDEIRQDPITLQLDLDGTSFHVWSSLMNGEVLKFSWNDSLQKMEDIQTRTLWDGQGKAVMGPLKGKQLRPVQGYQEFWHSWKSFHPNTTTYPG